MDRDPRDVLKQVWGFDAFRPMQEDVVRSVLSGHDTLALMPTGGGKSLCFQVPALAMGRLCLVVSPLIALMKDQVERLRSKGIRAAAITSGMEHREIDNTIESAAVGKLSFLYISPERIASEILAARLPRLPLGLLAVDEAHCISQWGFDFRPAYRNIVAVRSAHPKVPVLALTASATNEVAQDIMQQLDFRSPNVLRGSFARPELTLWVSRGEDKMGRLLRIAKNTEGAGIVYLRERRGTARIARFLQQHGYSAEAYHAGLALDERDRIQQDWTTGKVRFVCATNAFGMGIDKGDVRCVVHLEPPPDLESYYQEAGRAGRDQHPSHAFLLAHESDASKLRDKLKLGFPALADVRRVFQAFADQHGIALGSGLLESYALDLRELARRTALQPTTTNGALKVLELNGTIALSEGARTPSRVMIRADRNTVYHMRVNDPKRGELIEALLRMYGGLFEEPALIEENRLARHLKVATSTVEKGLRELHELRVIHYHPRNDAPQVTLLHPRQDAQRLHVNKEALHAREERAKSRLEAMLAFTFDAGQCRERMLLGYFGETIDADCGRCDVCRSKRPKDGGTDRTIAEKLSPTQQDIEELRWSLEAEIASAKSRRS
jgi:ATP-dependent DNA helicase RecQ